MMHLAVEGRQVVDVELVEMGMPARPCEDGHQFDGGLEEACEAPGGIIDHEALS